MNESLDRCRQCAFFPCKVSTIERGADKFRASYNHNRRLPTAGVAHNYRRLWPRIFEGKQDTKSNNKSDSTLFRLNLVPLVYNYSHQEIILRSTNKHLSLYSNPRVQSHNTAV